MTDIDWNSVRRVLVVRLRSIGDTVLATPSLIALRRFLPDARIDILLEDWVAPLLDGFGPVDNVIAVERGRGGRFRAAREIRRNRYDVVFNLHGGTSATFLTFLSGARHRIGYSHYQYSFLYVHLLSSSSDFWQREHTHSAEQQLALLGFVGVPVADRPKSDLTVTETAAERVSALYSGWPDIEDYALIHPTAAYATKQWSTENFARTAEYLYAKGLKTIAIAAKNETAVLEKLKAESNAPILTFSDLPLPQITALAAKAKLFVGNDSGIAHIAAAMKTPSVVIFGSSNIHHWRPWTDAPNEIVYHPLPCQPCPGYECKVFGDPKCILSVAPETVIGAIDRVLGRG